MSGSGNWVVAYPQMMDPNPQIAGNVQFRKALAHAINRQEMVDTFQAGLRFIGHSYVTPQDPAYRDIESSVVRYDYDPRRASQMIEELGNRPGRRRLVRKSTDRPRSPRGWRRRPDRKSDPVDRRRLAPGGRRGRGPGRAGTAHPRPRICRDVPGLLRASEPERSRAPRPIPQRADPVAGESFHGENNPRYANPEFDTLLDRYSATVARQPRMQILGQIVNHISDRVIMLGLFYTNEPTLISGRVQNVTARPPNSTQAWNAQEWDLP